MLSVVEASVYKLKRPFDYAQGDSKSIFEIVSNKKMTADK